jgi:Holliday junction resolvase RusA-like endonuclease
MFTVDDLPKLPNSLLGAHWTVRAGHAKSWHRKVEKAIIGAKPAKPLARARVTLVRSSPRPPDFDGLVGSFKPVLDALKHLGVIEDDTMIHIGQPDYRWEKAKRGSSSIRVVVEEANGQE